MCDLKTTIIGRGSGRGRSLFWKLKGRRRRLRLLVVRRRKVTTSAGGGVLGVIGGRG
jgi:hypothetical protein